MAKEIKLSINLILRFKEKLLPQPTGCIHFKGAPDKDGYRHLSIGAHGKILAHRASYVIHNGDIPKGMVVCHTCDNPACVHPDHLFIGTVADNNKDRDNKGRKGKSSSRLLSDVEILIAKEAFELGFTQIEIANYFKIGSAIVGYLIRNPRNKQIKKEVLDQFENSKQMDYDSIKEVNRNNFNRVRSKSARPKKQIL